MSDSMVIGYSLAINIIKTNKKKLLIYDSILMGYF